MVSLINASGIGASLQRSGLNHQAIEDYLKTLFTLSEEESPVSTSRIAEARQVKPASVTSMLQRLAKLGLIHYKKSYGATLTETGRKKALEVIRHHRLLELYLKEKLGFGWDEVHEQADLLEHVISEKLEERIATALNNPFFDPHGEPIPSKKGEMVWVDTTPLASLKAGVRAVVARVSNDANSDLLRYLARLGLVPGATVVVKDVAPFEGPITLEISGESEVLGHTAATSVLVTTEHSI